MIDKEIKKKLDKSLINLWYLLKKNKDKCKYCPIKNVDCFKEQLLICKNKYNSKNCRVVLATQYYIEQQNNNNSLNDKG